MGGRRRDLTGERRGMLTALYPIGPHPESGNIVWECKCDCGNVVQIPTGSFVRAKSCGCLRGKYARPTTSRRFQHFDRERIELAPGRTYEEYMLKQNEQVPYYRICKALGLSLNEARRIYDKVYNQELGDIGRIKPSRGTT